MIFLSDPQIRTFLAKKKIIGTGNIFPIIHVIYKGIIGSEFPNAVLKPIGTAPLNSIKGIIETKKTIKYFLNIY